MLFWNRIVDDPRVVALKVYIYLSSRVSAKCDGTRQKRNGSALVLRLCYVLRHPTEAKYVSTHHVSSTALYVFASICSLSLHSYFRS